MRSVRVKICGITRKEDLKMVCDLGADAVGFVVDVPSSPRNLSLEAAKDLIARVPIFVKSVLVTVPKGLDDIMRLYDELRVDIIQIHGETVMEYWALKRRLSDTILVRCLNVKSEATVKSALKIVGLFDAVLLDSYSAGKYGGTGTSHDWGIARRIREAIHPKPLILAGGLNPENVKDAVKTVKPYAVDVSTGVELKPGVKDPKKVDAFIKNVREASLELEGDED